MEKKAKRMLELETVSSRYTYEPTETVAALFKPEGFSLLRVGSSHGFPTLKQKLRATDIHLQTKN